MPHKLKDLLARVPSDIEIAQAHAPLPITQIASEAGILPDELEMYGKTKAKVHLSIRDRLKNVPNGKYVVITASRIFFTTRLVRSPEVGWTRTDPAARLVLSPNQAIQVFRLTGPLAPNRCPRS